MMTLLIGEHIYMNTIEIVTIVVHPPIYTQTTLIPLHTISP